MVEDIGWVYLSQGNLGEMFKWIFNTYFPFLTFWIIIGITIFTIIYVKSNDLSLSTSILTIYFIVIANFMVETGVGSIYNTVIKYVSLLLILFVFFLLYRSYKTTR